MITYAQACTIVEQTLACGREDGLPPLTVAVLDAGGHLVAFGREDRSSLGREQIARGKALGALNMGVGSRTLATRAEEHPQFFAALTALAEGFLVPAAGGVLIRDAVGNLLGAVGVSGAHSDADEACALRAIAAVDLRADPGE